MIHLSWLLALVVAAPQTPAPPDPLARDALARARTAYNERRFDDAVVAATEVGKRLAAAADRFMYPERGGVAVPREEMIRHAR